MSDYIERSFPSDEAANDFYLDLCEQYWEVRLVDSRDFRDGSCWCKWYVSE